MLRQKYPPGIPVQPPRLEQQISTDFFCLQNILVILTQKRTNVSLNLYLNGAPIQRFTEAKFLDLVLDHRLLWRLQSYS